MRLFERLFDGAIDIVGDVHGEIAALRRLLGRLGYDETGRHPDARRLVFLGDLTDRGPDSPAVLELVSSLVQAGRAQCLVGNHELNLLRDVRKHGNDWWTRPEAPGRLPARPVTPADKQRFTSFLRELPLVLEREDLRLVHACWNADAIATLREREADAPGVAELYAEYRHRLAEKWRAPERLEALKAERACWPHDLHDREHRPPLMPLLAEMEAEMQMGNPVAVLTSGEERPTTEPFWAGGRWRMVERVKWWERYRDPVPVIVGHYWRRYSEIPPTYADKYGPDLFAGIERGEWMGARGNVFCVDFSVGGRSEQRYAGEPEYICQLAALRVPEWRLVYDAADPIDIGAP